jgi:hypothetical protein
MARASAAAPEPAAAWGAFDTAVALINRRLAWPDVPRGLVTEGVSPERIVLALVEIAVAALKSLSPADEGATALRQLGLAAADISTAQVAAAERPGRR